MAVMNGQLNVYNSPDCSPSSFRYNTSGVGDMSTSPASAANNCTIFCSPIVPNGNTSMIIFNTTDLSEDVTTCYFFFTPSDLSTNSNTSSPFDYQQCGNKTQAGNYYYLARSGQGCFLVPAPPNNQSLTPGQFDVGYACFTGICPPGT